MSEPNLKAMTQAELLKYLEDDFMPRLLPKLANVKNIEAENARLKAEVERLKMEESKLLTLCETYEGDLERLRKAGDALASALILFEMKSEEERQGKIKAWSAAKEGKQP